MSEMNHTPLPWRYESWKPRGGYVRHGIGNKDGAGQILTSVRLTPANARLIVTSVNARPKVEGLVSLLLAWLDNQPDGRGEVELKVLAKAREVEAAFGGK